MSDLKRTIRDTEADAREAWRKADGHESIEDKAANARDRVGNAIDNAGDDLHEEADKVSREAEYERGREDEANMRVPH
jgi:F0F1-type ATP synthase membrane subunit b/b'